MWPVAAAMGATVGGSVAGLFAAAQAAPLCLFTSAQAGPLCLFGGAQAQEIRKASDVTVSAHRTVAGLLMDARTDGDRSARLLRAITRFTALPHPVGQHPTTRARRCAPKAWTWLPRAARPEIPRASTVTAPAAGGTPAPSAPGAASHRWRQGRDVAEGVKKVLNLSDAQGKNKQVIYGHGKRNG